MKQFIVVDDEQFIANSIANLIKTACPTIQLAGVFYSSEAALNFIHQHPVDIVVTDIQMPEINGLELIERINTINPAIQMIIVTGFGTFEYAQQAMALGVKFIFQKPVKPTDLTQAIEQVVESSKQSQKLHSLLTTDHLNDYLLHEDQDKPAIDQRFSWFMADSMHTDVFDGVFKKQFNDSQLLTSTIHHFTYYLVTAYSQKDMEEDFFETLTLDEGLLLYKHDVTMNTLKDVIAQGEKTLNMQFYYPEFHLMAIKHQDYLPENKYKKRFDTFTKEMIQLIETKDISYSKKRLEDFFEENKTLNHPKKIVLAESHSLVTKLMMHFKLHNLESVSEINKHISLAVYYQDVLKQVETVIEQVALETMSDSPSNDLASKINYIIEDHYMNPDLSLLWISKNVLFFNAEYLGREFSQRMGKKFNTKLTEYRIEMAKKLLLKRYKVYEVAKMVGYENNPEYFNLVFKKHIGITPLKFTKLNQGDD